MTLLKVKLGQSHMEVKWADRDDLPSRVAVIQILINELATDTNMNWYKIMAVVQKSHEVAVSEGMVNEDGEIL